jgi:FAD/FMN-containing dehydrogenase
MTDRAADLRNFKAAAIARLGAKYVLSGSDAEAFEHDFWKQNCGRAACIVEPTTREDVQFLVKLAAQYSISIVPQGGNTGLVNGGIPDATGQQVLLSLKRMNQIRAVDPAGDYIIVEAGAILAQVQKAAEDADRYFPLGLGAEGSCTIGGNIATNAGGITVLRYGMMRDLVLGLEVVLPNGEVLDLMRSLRKDNTGYDLRHIFIGSEGTLGIVTAAILKLVAPPRERVTIWVTVSTPAHAVELFRYLRGEFGDLISSFELISSYGVEAACTHLPGVRRPVDQPAPWHVLMEISWSFREGLRARAEGVLEDLFEKNLIGDGTIAENEAQRQMMWRIREGQSEATSKIGAIVRNDVTVPIASIPELVDRVMSWTPEFGQDVVCLPFGHIGDGNLHMNFVVSRDRFQDLEYRLLEKLYSDVDQLSGSISAEHGVGRMKREAIAKRKAGMRLELMHKLKSVIDPDGRFNPGVVIDPKFEK